jgi:hypothetical protein
MLPLVCYWSASLGAAESGRHSDMVGYLKQIEDLPKDPIIIDFAKIPHDYSTCFAGLETSLSVAAVYGFMYQHGGKPSPSEAGAGERYTSILKSLAHLGGYQPRHFLYAAECILDRKRYGLSLYGGFLCLYEYLLRHQDLMLCPSVSQILHNITKQMVTCCCFQEEKSKIDTEYIFTKWLTTVIDLGLDIQAYGVQVIFT